MEMNDLTYKTLLYDFYGEMLTARQQEVYEDYYLNDLSLAEVAEELGISRAAVHDNLKRSEKALEHLEDKLKLIKRYEENKALIETIRTLTYNDNKEEALTAIRELIEDVRQKI